MSKYVIGKTVEGKVSGVQRYGVFVSLDENTQGLVHISEVTNGFVTDITEYATVGEIIPVKVLSINEADGKIALSMKDVSKKLIQQKKARNAGRKRFPVETRNGFSVLKEKLDYWIQQEMKK